MLPLKAAVETVFAQSASAVDGRARRAAAATAPSNVLERVWSLSMSLRVAHDHPTRLHASRNPYGILAEASEPCNWRLQAFTALCCAA